MYNATKMGKSTAVGPRFLSVTFKKVLVVGGLLATLSGCSTLNIGNDDYACPGMPNGVQCMSAADVYSATNDGQVPRPMSPDEAEAKSEGNLDESGQGAAAPGSTRSSGDEVINTYVAPRLPNKPVPIRTPAQVMRIWVAPWEDTNGDLIVTGYVYTEIEPRRWVIGDSAPNSEPVIRPLQSAK